MKEKLSFLINVSKLKEIPRKGLLLMGVKNPISIGDHTFHTAFSAWLLSFEKGLNVKRAIEIALFHDICEIYAGDQTPFFYWDNLKRERKKDEKILLKGIRLSKEEKKKRGKMKFEKEKESLLKLISPLPSFLKNEIFSRWINFERKLSKEGAFVKQVDRIETLLEAIEFIGPKKIQMGTSWWELTEEIVEDPLLLEFLKVIQNRFYKKKIRKIKNRKELEAILDFLLKVGKLRKLSRLYWILRGIKKPETVAGHIFSVAIMAWIFGKEKKSLSIEKLLKMSLCHELSAVYTGDTTPYDRILPKNEKERKKVLEKMIRLSKKEKEWIFLKDYKEEKKALQKLTKKLPLALKKEILTLWQEYRKKSSPEGYFLSQLNTLAILLEGLIYEKRYKKFKVAPLWEWAFEVCDDKICLSLLQEMKKTFYGN